MNQLAIIDNKDLIFEPQNLTKETIRKYLCPQASDQELILGLQIAKTFNLNPMKREVYFVKYGTNPMSVLTGYEVYLKRAECSGQWGGMKAWTEGSIENGDLKACIEVYRKDWVKPLVHEVDYSEYVQKKSDGTPNKFWKEKPKTMIKKVAVSQAFRLAFPKEFDGMPYTSDEVVDQEKIVDIKPDALNLATIDHKSLEKEMADTNVDSPKSPVNTPTIDEKAWDEDIPSHIPPLKLENESISKEHKVELCEISKKIFKTKTEWLDWLKKNFNVSKVSEMNEWQYEEAVDLLVAMK